MKNQRIQLNKRIQNIKIGYSGEPNYIASTIYSFANNPIGKYLNQHLDDLEKLVYKLKEAYNEILTQTYEQILKLTYQEFAVIIFMYMENRHFNLVNEATNLLSLPMRKYYEERLRK